MDGLIIASAQRNGQVELFEMLERSRIPCVLIDRMLAGVDASIWSWINGTHKHPEVRKWLAAPPRYRVHFTPTGSSWLNQIERLFAEITRNGSAAELSAAFAI